MIISQDSIPTNYRNTRKNQYDRKLTERDAVITRIRYHLNGKVI